MNRVDLLKQGIELTSGDRNIQYGEPRVNFANVAALWTAYLQSKYDMPAVITPEDVAWLNVLQKCGRTFLGVPKEDSYIDAAIFAAIAGEVA